MKKFEAKSLEEVYELATTEFDCSITQLNIEIEQQASKGFLGFGKKNAIISVSLKRNNRRDRKPREQKFKKKDIQIEEVSKKIEDSNKRDEQRNRKKKASEKRHEKRKREPKRSKLELKAPIQ